jgi:hypothetical protein
MESFAIIAMNGVYKSGFENLCCQFCKTQGGSLFARLNPNGGVIEGDITCGGHCFTDFEYKNGEYKIKMCEDCNLTVKECECITCENCGESVCVCMTCPKCAVKESPYIFCNGGCDGCGLCSDCCVETTCIHREEE